MVKVCLKPSESLLRGAFLHDPLGMHPDSHHCGAMVGGKNSRPEFLRRPLRTGGLQIFRLVVPKTLESRGDKQHK